MNARRMTALVAAAWAFLGVCSFQALGQGQEKPAALVNGEAISMAELKAVLDQRPSPVPLTAAQQRELRHAALDLLIDDVLMRQFLRKNAPPATAAEIQKEMDELTAALKKQNKTVDQWLKDSKQTEEQLRQDIVARLQWKHYLAVRFPDAEVKSYYEANKVLFDKVFVRASHILVKVGTSATAQEKQTARAKIETLRAEITAGKISFEEAAKKYSECPSKDKGGDIGQFPYKFVVVEPFAKAAYALKVGALSDVVTTDFGYHLIKVTERTPGEASTFESSKDSAREVMAQEMDLYNRSLAEERKKAKIEVLLQ